MSGGFRCLESLSEEALALVADFSDQTSNDIEILTYVCDGSLVQQDPSGAPRFSTGRMQPHEFPIGASYRTTNVSPDRRRPRVPLPLTPDRASLRTHAEKKYFPIAERRGLLRLILSSNGRNGSLRSAATDGFSSVLDPGHHLVHELATEEGVASGGQRRIQLSDQVLNAGDEPASKRRPRCRSPRSSCLKILLFDLP